MQQTTYRRRTAPLILDGFLSSFNDSIIKTFTLIVIVSLSGGYCLASSAFALALLLAWVLPPLILAPVAGFVIDRMPKRYVLMIAEFASLFNMILAIRLVGESGVSGDPWYLLPVFAVSSVVSAFHTPAFEGLMPEMYSESEISRACGGANAAKWLGLICGIASGVAMFADSNGKMDVYMIFLCASSAAAFLTAGLLPCVVSPFQADKSLAYSSLTVLKKGFLAIYRSPSLALAASGDVLFIAIGISIQPLLYVFGRDSLHLDNALDFTVFQLSPFLGMAIGCALAGRLSQKKLELGLVPIGSLGMALALPLLVLLPGDAGKIMMSLPSLFSPDYISITLTVHAGAVFAALLAGVSGGLFSIPIKAFLFQRLAPELRGAALSLKNTTAVLFTTAALFFTTAFSASGIKNLPPVLRSMVDSVPDIPNGVFLAAFGIAVFAMTALTMWLLPNFMLRFVILALGNTVYRIRINGAENIPDRGGAMLLANHVSYADSVLISACTSRQIRFLMDESYFRYPVIGFIARMTGFFKVPSAGKPKQMRELFEAVADHLREGGIVCVCPEGRISRNGCIGRFSGGFRRMLPTDVDIPLIPVNVSFVWGNIFSYVSGRIKIKKTNRFPFFSAVTFGSPLSRDITPFEARQAVAELDAEAGYPCYEHERTIHYELAHQAKFHPARQIVADAGGTRLNAFALHLKSVLLSREIRRLSPSSESKYVGVLLPNGTAAAVSIMAVLYADKVPSPLNYSVSQEVFELSVAKAHMNCILTSRAFLEKIRISPVPEMVFLEDILPRISKSKAAFVALATFILPTHEFMNMFAPLSAFERSGEAALLFSSGSTGVPKGVVLTHHNLYSDLSSIAKCVAITEQDVVVGNLPLFHSFGLNVCFWLPVMYGFRTVFTPSPLDASLICETIGTEKATLLFATPSFLQKYIQRAKKEQFASIRLVVTGAEKLRRDIAEKLHSFTDGTLTIVEGYGCTELSPVVTINVAESVTDTGRKCGREGSIGLPLENIAIRILDPLTFKPVPPNSEGLVFVKGPMVMKGYLDAPEMTSKVIINGFYNTGDIAKMDEAGYITICGRLSRFSKIAGEMVPHEMVESIINEICGSETRAVAVCGMPDRLKGEVLIVLYTDDMKPTPDEIVDTLRERSISNLWIPKVKNFHKIKHLPLLGSGKLDLAALRARADEIYAAENTPEI